nr:Transcription initiation factor TFIID subunit 5 [Polyrhizophydium stewartii]
MELRVILFPIFVHAYLDLVEKGLREQALHFYELAKTDHMEHHIQDMHRLSGIVDAQHMGESEFVQNFRQNKYGVKMSKYAFELLLCFLQDNKFMLLLRIMNQYVSIQAVSDKSAAQSGDVDEGVGLVGQQVSQLESFNREPISLGMLPPDVVHLNDVERAITLQREADTEELKQQLEAMIKAPVDPDAPRRDNVPLPNRRRFELQEELDHLRDLRSQIKLGPSALPSICCYTMHNGNGSINCLRASTSAEYLAAGFSDSFIKLWSAQASEPPRRRGNAKAIDVDPIRPSSNLIGHSGPVFGLDFNSNGSYLLSCSEDRTIRLWSTHTKTNLVVYKGHNYPVFDVSFGPHDVYFASASYDRTARLWSCDHLFPLRVFVGHLADVDTVRFHPNSNYILTGSSDRTCRLWDVQKGTCVRIFSKHQGAVSAVAVSPDGRTMASAGEDRVVRLWDLGTGRRIKTMHGHTSAVSSLEFSRDGSLLASGGADDSVRLWDVKRADAHEIKMETQMGDTMRPDHVAAFPTKRTPVYSVQFTQRNVLLALGVFEP